MLYTQILYNFFVVYIFFLFGWLEHGITSGSTEHTTPPPEGSEGAASPIVAPHAKPHALTPSGGGVGISR